MKIPYYLKKYFWDVDFNSIDLPNDSDYISARLLEYGDVKAARWLLEIMGKPRLEKIVQNSRKISARSGSFWSRFFGIDRDKVKCLKKSYQKMQKSHWR
ncbi:MAG: hypothetical protein A3J76_01620 [Candidatus Moranbacteria bacterium RBG_13_45_13]|nr:MAG: hypothetical protein A3J76_01620 [Candidatus Moranbacteria bacterium RBG_13_45_13]